MKLEMDDNSFWLALWLGLATTLAVGVIGCTYYYNKRIEVIVSAGYVEKMVPYNHTAVWQKP